MHFYKRSLLVLGTALALSQTAYADSSVSSHTQPSDLISDSVNEITDAVAEPQDSANDPLSESATPVLENTVVSPEVATANLATALEIGWIQTSDNHISYRTADGTLQIGWLVDAETNARFFFDQSGRMQTGLVLLPGSNQRVLFDTKGQQLTGWQQIDNTWYFFNPDNNGVAATDWYFSPQYQRWFLFDANGRMLTGWQFTARDNSWFYLNPDGTMQTGWIQPNGSARFYLDADGRMKTGWVQPEGTTWYYFNEQGYMQTGWIKPADQNWYYLEADGKMKTGWLYDNYFKGWYLLAEHGAMRTGWVTPTNETALYYLDESGKMKTNWQKNNDKWLYLDENGRAVKGWLLDKTYNKWFYLDKDYTMLTGWQQLDNRKWFYLNGGGDMATGWQKIGEHWYYMNSLGEMVTGAQNINGHRYLFADHGAWIQGLLREGDWHYQYDDSGKKIAQWSPNKVMKVLPTTAYIYNDNNVPLPVTYVNSGTLVFVNDAAPVISGYTAVLISGVRGYMKTHELTAYTGRAPHYLNENGIVYHYYGQSDSEYYRVGTAPESMKANVPYYSYDSNNFAGFTLYTPTVFTDLRTTTNYTAEQLNAVYRQQRNDSMLVDAGAYFKEAEKQYQVNALYLIAHSALESAWGTSKIARDKNNFFGIAAYDHNPYDAATKYSGIRTGILDGAKFIANRYLSSNSAVHRGPFVGDKASGMNVNYASDPYWGRKIASIMDRFERLLKALP